MELVMILITYFFMKMSTLSASLMATFSDLRPPPAAGAGAEEDEYFLPKFLKKVAHSKNILCTKGLQLS